MESGLATKSYAENVRRLYMSGLSEGLQELDDYMQLSHNNLLLLVHVVCLDLVFYEHETNHR